MVEIAATAVAEHTVTIAGPNTLEGTILGTVNYMSPEQAEGKPVDPRSDIFSLGAVLYEMATGRKAFDGDTTISTITAILRDEPKPISGIAAPLPREFERVVARCLRKEPDRRFQTALDVRNALEELHEDLKGGSGILQPPPAGPAAGAIPTPARLPNRRVFAIAAAGIAILIAAGWAVSRSMRQPEEPAASIVVRPFSDLPGYKGLPSFSPDGNAIVMAWNGGDLTRSTNIYAMLLDGGKPLRLTTSTDTDSNAFYSPDGRRVFFTRSNVTSPVIFSVPSLGGDATRIAAGRAASVSADGQWLLLYRGNAASGIADAGAGVFVLNLATGQERLLLSRSTDYDDVAFEIAPDGKWVYFSRSQMNQPGVAMRIPFDGGSPERVRLPALGDRASQIVNVRFFGRNAGMKAVVRDKDGRSTRAYLLKPDGTEPVALPPNIPVNGSISQDGRRMIDSTAYFISPLYRVAAFPARGEKPVAEKVLDSPRYESSPQFSPDGSRMALSSNRTGRSELWVWNAGLSEGKPVFDRPSQTSGSPAWSPDGRLIAFDARVRTWISDVWIVAASGGEPRQLTDHPAEDITPCFDPSGEQVYFTSDRDGEQQLYRVPVGGGQAARVTKAGGFTCQFSPDGKFIYYLQSRARGGLWRLEVTTGKEEPVLPEYKNRNWKVLSDGIYLFDIRTTSQLRGPNTTEPGRSMFYRFASRKVENLGFVSPKPAGNNGIELSADRKWLYYSQLDSRASDLLLVENLPFR
jgi:eukaryotic-like serine/threonine-protein kinase